MLNSTIFVSKNKSTQMPNIDISAPNDPAIKNTCMNCIKKEHSLLNELAYHELETLENNRTVVDYKKGEVICKEGTRPLGLLCLNAGKVKIMRKAHNGIEQIIALKKPVNFINLRAVVNDEPYHTSAISLDDSSVCIIGQENFLKVINNNPGLSLKIIRSLTKELDEADARFANMTQKHLHARLADALLLLYDIYGTLPDGKTLNCTMKRAELAAMSNMTTANVIRTLSAFEKEDLVRLVKKQIKITDIERMKQTSHIS
jgi:CRP/FNR family transcriptional regulator